MRTIIHKLSMLGIEEDMPYDLKTRVKLINQINIATIIAGLFSLSSNIIFAQYELIIPGALSISIMALPLYFSSRKRYELASSFLLSTFGLTLLMMSILLGKQTQAYFAFFPAIVLSTLLVTGLKRYIFLIYYLALLFASFFLFADAEPFVIVPNPDLITLTVIVTSLIGSFYVLGFYNKMLETQSKEIERYNRSLEALVDERTHKLEDSLKELKRSNEDLEQFAYAASHDLQEPLRMIRNFSQLIERKLRPSFDEDTETYMHFIQEAVLRMSDLIKGLLAFSRVGRKEVQLEITDIAHLIQEKLKDLRGIIEEKKASIQFSD
ncbi:MAG: histidine kinase dimerization/phospho-acceptor domain-containing protein [Bacteroidota bacterium]